MPDAATLLATLLATIPAAAWAAVTGGLSSVLTWRLGVRGMRNAARKDREKFTEDYAASEQADRAQFRTTLMSDLAALRALQKECEVDRDHLRGRINDNAKQILMLKASAEIMQKWLDFFRKAETAMPGALNALIASIPAPIIDPEWAP